VEWDAFAIWGFKAKVLTHEALRPTPAYFHDLTLSYSHLDYPLMVPFLRRARMPRWEQLMTRPGNCVGFSGCSDCADGLSGAAMETAAAAGSVLERDTGHAAGDVPIRGRPVARTCRWRCFMPAAFFTWPDGLTGNNGPDSFWQSCLALRCVHEKRRDGIGVDEWRGAPGIWTLGRSARAWVGAVVFFAGLLAMDAAWLIWNRGLGHAPRRLLIEIIVIGFGDPFAKIKGNYSGDAGANSRIPGLGSVVDHGGDAGAVGMAGVGTTIRAGPCGFCW